MRFLNNSKSIGTENGRGQFKEIKQSGTSGKKPTKLRGVNKKLKKKSRKRNNNFLRNLQKKEVTC